MQLLPLSVEYNRSLKRADFTSIAICRSLYTFGMNNVYIRSKIQPRVYQSSFERTDHIKTILDGERLVFLRTKLHDLLNRRKSDKKYKQLVDVLYAEPEEVVEHTVEIRDGFRFATDRVNGEIVNVVQTPLK